MPGDRRRDAECRKDGRRLEESRGSRSDDATQHGITVAAVLPAQGFCLAAVVAPADAGDAGDVVAGASRGPRHLH